MPTIQEFEAFEKVVKTIASHPDTSAFPTSLAHRWPNPVDQMAFLRWQLQRGNELQKVFDTPGATSEQLIELIDNMSYNSHEERCELLRIIDSPVVPWIHVGKDKYGSHYRISPQSDTLYPDKEFSPPGGNEPLPTSVLGVNLNVQPRNPPCRRRGHYAEESNMSNESDDTSDTGFVFHQIGILEEWVGDSGIPKSKENISQGPWFPTGFGVVVKFGRNGLADGIYIIYNFLPVDDCTYERAKCRSDHPTWGYLGRRSDKFAVAKIANQMSSLGFNRPLSLDQVVDHPVELVNAVHDSAGFIIRTTVADVSCGR
ncbi:uncharacterized protein GIQ15_03128 [Arthroderma uncinatum]|uniref:uncharacterized protein n=1 Tax=Arthroderma uncinatum TaxID=74035 RepID=UPI00144A6874|nr:uncharacterized protein GIQ15_03128 [Arthroderma uncinatum]KAF3483804.1 hypothetical protein GIQ15_03128 [Arthroderma uncinatum]